MKTKSFLNLCFLYLVFQTICAEKSPITYTFPVDACSVEPYVVDETSLVFMRFNGRDIGSIECRQMQFTTPHSWFYNYKLFMKMVYFESPDCSIYLRCMSNQDDYWACCDEDLRSEGCSSDNLYGQFAYCAYDNISFKLKHLGDRNYDYNRYDYGYKTTTTKDPLLRLQNSTFKFQIEAKLHPDYRVIGGLAGGIAGLILLVGVTSCICVTCRERKNRTGKYCGTFSSYNFRRGTCCNLRRGAIKEFVADGFSTECAFGEMLLCSCICCRHKKRTSNMSHSCEAVTLMSDDSSSGCEDAGETKETGGNTMLEPDTVKLINDV